MSVVLMRDQRRPRSMSAVGVAAALTVMAAAGIMMSVPAVVVSPVIAVLMVESVVVSAVGGAVMTMGTPGGHAQRQRRQRRDEQTHDHGSGTHENSSAGLPTILAVAATAGARQAIQ